MRITDLLNKESILLGGAPKSKSEAIDMLVELQAKGGNISDKATQQLALEAARKAKFTEGDHDQIGTITYNFKFN